jgi:hypothetical protein
MIPHLAVRIPYRPWSLSLDAERTTPRVSVTATDVRELDGGFYVFRFTTCSRSILCSVRAEAYLSNDYLLNCWYLKSSIHRHPGQLYHWSESAPDREAYKENGRDLK